MSQQLDNAIIAIQKLRPTIERISELGTEIASEQCHALGLIRTILEVSPSKAVTATLLKLSSDLERVGEKRNQMELGDLRIKGIYAIEEAWREIA